MTKEQAKALFGKELEPGTYEVVFTITGGLLVGGFDKMGLPIPGKQEVLSEEKFMVEIKND